MEQMGICGENEAMFTLLILFFEMGTVYAGYNLS